jgi:hypothetical protein
MGAVKKPNVPSWFKTLKSDSLLNARDVAQIFGFASAAHVYRAVCGGRLPTPDYVLKSGCASAGFSSNRVQWYKKTIIKEILRRKAL